MMITTRAVGARAMYIGTGPGRAHTVYPVFGGIRPGSSSQLHGSNTDIKNRGAECSKSYEQNGALDFFRTLYIGIVDVRYKLHKTCVLCFRDETL